MINLKFNELREVHAKPHGVEKKCSEYIDRNILRSISNMMCTNNVQFKKKGKNVYNFKSMLDFIDFL